MSPDACNRLKSELANRGLKANDVSVRLGFSPTYISRLVTGEIEEPSAKRIKAICDETGIQWTYILTGQYISPERKKLLDDLAEAPESVVEKIVDFVNSSGFGKS